MTELDLNRILTRYTRDNVRRAGTLNIRRRDELPKLNRAVSDALDEYLIRLHGITASWADPIIFENWLEKRGYTIVPIEVREDVPALVHTLDEALGLLEDWDELVGESAHMTWALDEHKATKAALSKVIRLKDGDE